MPKNYLEQDFEEHIEENLLSSGYHKCLPEDYDREACLLPAEVLKFIQETQPKEYKKLTEPQVNTYIKREWFDKYTSMNSKEGRIAGVM